MIPHWPIDRDALKQWRPWIPGDPETEDIMAAYRALIPSMPRPCHLVEVGVAFGRSLLYAASQLQQRGSAGDVLWAVDPWPWELRHRPGRGRASFRSCLLSLVCGAWEDEIELVRIVRLRSPAAAVAIGETRLDGVMIDGDHAGPAVAADIRAWRELVRPGGWIAGHDYTREFPGVQAAVDEAFDGRHVLRGTVWAMQL